METNLGESSISSGFLDLGFIICSLRAPNRGLQVQFAQSHPLLDFFDLGLRVNQTLENKE